MISMSKLAGLLSYTERQVVVGMAKELDSENMTYVASKLADKLKITRSVIVNAQAKLEIAEIIETRSLGMKGTNIRVLEPTALKQLVELIG